MDLIKKIKKDIKEAMVSGDKSLAESLKYIYSLLQTEEARGGEFDPIKVLQKEMKAKKEALKMFEDARRQELVEKEKKEIEILDQYLPEMMSDEEIANLVEEVIAKLDKADFGQVMGQVMSKAKGKADGSQVAKVVKRKINENIN